jgi:uncharacterized protein YkwD
MKNLIFSLAVGMMLVNCGGGGATPSEVNGVQQTVDANVLSTSKQEMLDAINAVRATSRDCKDGKGVIAPADPLTWNDNLYASALEHATDLAKSNTFSHMGSGTVYDITGYALGRKSLFYERIGANGYGVYRSLGENIAGGQKTLQEAVNAWVTSPDHCSNLMSHDFKELGMSVVIENNSKYGIYWAQNFGSK